MLTSNGKLLQRRLDAQVGDPYEFGPEDCSELFFDVMGPEGFGVVSSRVTADDYYHMGVRIAKPELVGDYFIELTSGTDHAHHIGMFYGPDAAGVLWTVEARGKDYGTPKYRLDDPHNGAPARGGIWMRLPKANLGPIEGSDPMAWEGNWIEINCTSVEQLVSVRAECDSVWVKDIPDARDPLTIHAHVSDAKTPGLVDWLRNRHVHGQIFPMRQDGYKHVTSF